MTTRAPAIWLNLTTSSQWGRPAVGIVRVEQVLCRELGRLLGPRFRQCRWQEPAFVDVADASQGLARGDVLISLGLDWDHAYHRAFFTLAREQGIHIISCVYDLIPILFPQYCVGDVAQRFKDYLNQLAWSSSAVLCISEQSRRDFVATCERFGAPAVASHVIRLGDTLPGAEGPISPAVRELLAEPFLLFVSTIERRKNHDVLYRAYHLLARAGHGDLLPKLVFVGMPGWHVGDLLHDIALDPMVAGRIQQLHEVSDAELALLYRQATFCLYPSIYEGWGLPVGEALAFGKVVLASGEASIPEVGGELVTYLSPWNAQAWADAMLELLASPARLQAQAARVREAYRAASWEDTARSVIEVIDGVLAAAPVDAAEPLDTAAAASEIAPKNPASAAMSSEPYTGPRQFFVDVSVLVQTDSRTGVQRVVRSILAELLAAPPAGFVVEPVFSSGAGGYFYARGFSGKTNESQRFAAEEKLLARRGDLFLGLDLAPDIVPQNAAFYATLRQLGAEVYFVAYDLLPLAMPQYFPAATEGLFARWLATVVQADGIIAISRAVADEIAARLPQLNLPPRLRPLKLGWFHLGADVKASLPVAGLPEDAEMMLAAMDSRPTFLMVGTLEPRKGHQQTLEAFERLWDRQVDVNLVIVGKRGWRVGALSHAILRNGEVGRRLFWLEGASDEYLEKIYAHADCLIAAAEGEGFGLPLVEAGFYKLPILARELPVFREVAGDQACYFSGADPDVIADRVVDWLAMQAAGTAPQSAGLGAASWKQSREQLENVILKGSWYR